MKDRIEEDVRVRQVEIMAGYRDAPSSKRNANQTIETKNRGGKILLDFCWLLNAGIVGDGQLIQAGQVTQVAHVT